MSTVAIYRKQIEDMTPYHDIHDLLYQDTFSRQFIRYSHIVPGWTRLCLQNSLNSSGMDSTMCGVQTLFNWHQGT